MTELIPNTSTPTSTEQHGNQIVWGNRITVATNVTVNAISWYHSGTGNLPTHVVLYDAATQAVLESVATSGQTTTAGWKSQAITSRTLSGGHDYVVACSRAASNPGSWFIAYWSTGAPSVGSPFTQVGARFSVDSGTQDAYPGSNSSAQLAAVSIGDGGGFTSGGAPTTPAAATQSDVQNALADWLDPTDATKPTSDVKVYPKAIGGLWRALLDLANKLGTAMPTITQPELFLSQVLTDLWNRPAPKSNAATTGDVTAARDAVNTHTDTAGAALATIIGTHDTEVKAAVTDAGDALATIIGTHDTEVKAAVTDAQGTIVTAIEAAQAAIGDGINAHDAGVKDALDTATTAVDDHTDGAQAELDARIDAHDAGVKGTIATTQSAITTAITAARNAVNTHTDGAATAINANTDANVNGLGILLSAEHTASATASATAHAAILAAVVGETGVLAAITALTSAIAAVAGVVADVLTILNALRGGSGTAHQTASADFTASPFLFAQPGDYYDVEITAWSSRQGATALAVGTWLPYIAWAAPLYGTVYGPKVTLNFSQQRIVCQHGATGLLVFTKAGAQGHVRAFQAS